MKLIFAGSPQIAASALRQLAAEHEVVLVITMPDSPVGRSKTLTPTAVGQTAAELGLETIKTRKVSPEIIHRIAESGAERAVVLAYGAMIPKDALKLMPWLNLHFSILPKWRGATPLQHSIINRTGMGLTIFQLDAGMDTGPILHTHEIDLDSDKTAGELLAELTDIGVSDLLQLLDAENAPTEQDGEATFAPKLSREDAKVDLRLRAVEVHRRIMAFNPEPVAWVQHKGEPLRILRSKPIGDVNWNGLAGDDFAEGEAQLANGRAILGCGNGTRLELIEVQPAGKRAMNAADWLRGLGGSAHLE